jgi:hypothetical protein
MLQKQQARQGCNRGHIWNLAAVVVFPFILTSTKTRSRAQGSKQKFFAPSTELNPSDSRFFTVSTAFPDPNL